MNYFEHPPFGPCPPHFHPGFAPMPPAPCPPPPPRHPDLFGDADGYTRKEVDDLVDRKIAASVGAAEADAAAARTAAESSQTNASEALAAAESAQASADAAQQTASGAAETAESAAASAASANEYAQEAAEAVAGMVSKNLVTYPYADGYRCIVLDNAGLRVYHHPWNSNGLSPATEVKSWRIRIAYGGDTYETFNITPNANQLAYMSANGYSTMWRFGKRSGSSIIELQTLIAFAKTPASTGEGSSVYMYVIGSSADVPSTSASPDVTVLDAFDIYNIAAGQAGQRLVAGKFGPAYQPGGTVISNYDWSSAPYITDAYNFDIANRIQRQS